MTILFKDPALKEGGVYQKLTFADGGGGAKSAHAAPEVNHILGGGMEGRRLQGKRAIYSLKYA